MSQVLLPWLVSFLGGFICVPFFTLFERKILSYMQKRKGPKKVSMMGLLQPMTDGVKLMAKEGGKPVLANSLAYWLSPSLSFCVMSFSFLLFPSLYPSYSLKFGLLFFLCVAALKVYSLLGSGMGSKSKYTLLGSIRGSAQSMSYEVSLITILFVPCILSGGYKMASLMSGKKFSLIIFFPLMMAWLMVMLAETNRAPFDFAEGESELVSGFKTEYGSLQFALLFLGEYGSMVFMCLLTSVLFFFAFKSLLMATMSMGFMFFFMWARGSFPRFRYDFLMNLAWQWMLPVSFGYLWLALLSNLKNGVLSMSGR